MQQRVRAAGAAWKGLYALAVRVGEDEVNDVEGDGTFFLADAPSGVSGAFCGLVWVCSMLLIDQQARGALLRECFDECGKALAEIIGRAGGKAGTKFYALRVVK